MSCGNDRCRRYLAVQAVTTNARRVAHTGHPADLLRHLVVNCRFSPAPPFPVPQVKEGKAAILAVHVA
jgi:hypothetical protein